MSKPVEILLIEDDDVDAERTKRLLKKQGLDCYFSRAFDGISATKRLVEDPRPNILLLDLRMPRMGGFEFLDWAKNNGILNTTPAIVLTTSHDDTDRNESLKRGASAFISKSNLTTCTPPLAELIINLSQPADPV